MSALLLAFMSIVMLQILSQIWASGSGFFFRFSFEDEKVWSFAITTSIGALSSGTSACGSASLEAALLPGDGDCEVFRRRGDESARRLRGEAEVADDPGRRGEPSVTPMGSGYPLPGDLSADIDG